MIERVLLDRRSERPKLLPFGDSAHLAVALLPEIPEPLVVHLLVLGSRDEACGGLLMVDRSVAADPGASRLRLGRRPQRLGRALGVIEAPAIAYNGVRIVLGLQFGMQHGITVVDSFRWRSHALAPFRIWAIWMNFIGTPMRSAQPRWCIRHELSAETIYSAPAWA